MGSEKEDLLAAVLTWRNTVKQLEAHVKEAGKQREGLEGELLAERLMKEQKVKVRRETEGQCLRNLLCDMVNCCLSV